MGKVDPKGIHASPDALKESNRLDQIFDENVKKESQLQERHWVISYLNIRSLKCHRKDVMIDNVLMQSDVLSFGETWLNPGETIDFDGYLGHFANGGRGKGVSAFTKTDSISSTLLDLMVSTTFSAIHLRINDEFDIIFLYISKGYNKIELFNLLNNWINNENPTAIMGDVNWNFSEECEMKQFLLTRDFEQLIDKATCDSGNLIDHLYVNQPMKLLNIFSLQQPAYYTDHDIISLYIEKKTA